MAYTATKYFSPKAFPFPAGFDNTFKTRIVRGQLLDCDTATEYTPGGVGSTSFEVTAFSAVGLVTYAALKGVPLVNGQLVVIYNTASNTNDGTYIVSQVTSTTFVAVPLPGKTLAGSAQTSQTAEGVGQIQWSARAQLNQTFTVTVVAQSGTTTTYTYTTLTGPQLFPGQKVVIAGCANAGNNGQQSINAVTQTSATAGSFTVTNASGVSTDSGTGTGQFQSGVEATSTPDNPIQVSFFSSEGYTYVWNAVNQTVQIFLTGSASADPMNEAELGATVAFDSTITFEAIFTRAAD